MAFQAGWDKYTDQQLRPWTLDKEMNDTLDHAYQTMNVGFKNTAPMDKTSAISELDRKPAAFVALETKRRLLAETGKMVSRMKIATPEPQKTKEPRPTTTSSARELLLKTNHLLTLLDSKSSSRSGTARALSSGSGGGSLGGTSSSRHLLDSIKYEARKGPATFNMSANEYQKFSQRMDGLASNNADDYNEGLPQQEDTVSERPMTTQNNNNNHNTSTVVDSDTDQDSSNIDANAFTEETIAGQGDGTNTVPLDEPSTDEENNNNDDVQANNRNGGVSNSNSSPTKNTQLPRIQDHPSTRPSTVGGGGGGVYTLESITGGLFKDPSSPQKQPPQPPLLSMLLAPAQGPGSSPSARRLPGRSAGAGDDTTQGGSVSGGGGSVSVSQSGRRTNSDWLKVEGSGGAGAGAGASRLHSSQGSSNRLGTAAASGAVLGMLTISASGAGVGGSGSTPPSEGGSGAVRSTHISRDGAFTLFGNNNDGPESSSSSSGFIRSSPSHLSAPSSSSLSLSPPSSSLSPSSSSMSLSRLPSSNTTTLTRPNSTSKLSSVSMTLKTGNDRTFSHKRIKELKALKELTMTQSGSFGLNVHPDVSQECLDENKRMRLVTQACVADCIERNQTDSTGPLLITPAYMDTIGPKKFYLSTIHETIDNNEQFKHAVKNADLSKGVKTDATRVWIENAAKQHSPMFVSGGGFKM